jgi:enoyl-CoA hydratase
MILTGGTMTGPELEGIGLVNKTFPAEDVLRQAVDLAERIANMSAPVVAIAKRAVLHGTCPGLRHAWLGISRAKKKNLIAENTDLDSGMVMEKALYYSTFSYADCKEGISAFLEKRKPAFTDN